ncbi:MAG: hypothetical protein GDA56_32515 [Hormoscilla sp. GM7CHS1pb]|nr:hypothetical protein [Hormoscilla sp. GM7CHS1pb]
MTLAWTLIVYHNYHVSDSSYEIHRGDRLLKIMLDTINMLICQVPHCQTYDKCVFSRFSTDFSLVPWLPPGNAGV